jgi:hypothetical protein
MNDSHTYFYFVHNLDQLIYESHFNSYDLILIHMRCGASIESNNCNHCMLIPPIESNNYNHCMLRCEPIGTIYDNTF